MSAEKVDLLAMFPPDVGQLVLDYNGLSPEMPLQTIEKHSKLSPHNFILFKRLIDDAAVSEPLLTSVVQANPVQLIEQVRANPGHLFKKGQKTDFAGQIFYNISAFQLMLFLCDADMLNQFKKIMPSIPQVYNDVMKKQRAEIDSGGSDLVKMDRDPTTLRFKEVTRFATSYNINGVPTAVTFPLLENPDGIIYYQEPIFKVAHLYYANKITQTIELLRPRTNSIEDQRALIELYVSFAAMENNSSRRSSNAEHELIARTMQHQLSRKGIQYVHKGIHYCDSRMEFRLVHAYRKNIRAYGEERGDNIWCQEVGEAQRHVLWVLQRLCEPGRPFYPMPDFNASPFMRGFTIYNFLTNSDESVCSPEGLVSGLGRDFAIYKGGVRGAAGCGLARATLRYGLGGVAPLLSGLVAVNRLIEDAKASVVEFTPGKDVIADDADSNLPSGPG